MAIHVPLHRRSTPAAVIVIAAALAVACGATPASSNPASSVALSPVASTGPVAIASGRYAGPLINVSDIMTKLEATSLEAAEKDAILDEVLVIRGHKTLQAVVEVRDGTKWIGGQRVDGGQPRLEAAWPLTQVDDHTVLLDTVTCCGVQVWSVQAAGTGFSMRALSPATGGIEAFVRSILFETGPFTPVA